MVQIMVECGVVRLWWPRYGGLRRKLVCGARTFISRTPPVTWASTESLPPIRISRNPRSSVARYSLQYSLLLAPTLQPEQQPSASWSDVPHNPIVFCSCHQQAAGVPVFTLVLAALFCYFSWCVSARTLMFVLRPRVQSRSLLQCTRRPCPARP